ncbi:hypothetical protein AMTRI_Chr07g25140 [Amborella trichopoda]
MLWDEPQPFGPGRNFGPFLGQIRASGPGQEIAAFSQPRSGQKARNPPCPSLAFLSLPLLEALWHLSLSLPEALFGISLSSLYSSLSLPEVRDELRAFVGWD